MATILLAEDDSSLCAFLKKALINAGHNVTSFNNGKNAFDELAQDTHYDLLLADIVMPGMDGIELAQKATTQKPTLKVMFITGFAAVAMSRHNRPAARAHTAETRVLSKPFHLKELVNQVDQLLAA